MTWFILSMYFGGTLLAVIAHLLFVRQRRRQAPITNVDAFLAALRSLRKSGEAPGN